MSRYKTAEEVEKHHIEVMGNKLGPIFHAIYNEIAWLYIKWNQYVEIYGTKPSRIELINKAAPLFFRIVQDSLFEDIIIHIARLTDPPKSVGKPNLTIKRFPELIENEILKNNLSELINIALDKAEFCRDWRNRRIAHRDLNLALKEGANPLKPASRQKIREALEAFSALLNTISVHFMDSTIVFGKISDPGGALSLLYVIDDGLSAEKERRERIRKGDYKSEDIRHREL
jgi:hypothetical protein